MRGGSSRRDVDARLPPRLRDRFESRHGRLPVEQPQVRQPERSELARERVPPQLRLTPRSERAAELEGTIPSSDPVADDVPRRSVLHLSWRLVDPALATAILLRRWPRAEG